MYGARKSPRAPPTQSAAPVVDSGERTRSRGRELVSACGGLALALGIGRDDVMTLSRLKHDFGFDLTIQRHAPWRSVAHPCGSSVPKACRRPCTGYRLPPMRVGGLTKPTRAQSLELLPKSSMALTEHGANAPSESEETSSGDVTRLLQSARAGDRAALD